MCMWLHWRIYWVFIVRNGLLIHFSWWTCQTKQQQQQQQQYTFCVDVVHIFLWRVFCAKSMPHPRRFRRIQSNAVAGIWQKLNRSRTDKPSSLWWRLLISAVRCPFSWKSLLTTSCYTTGPSRRVVLGCPEQDWTKLRFFKQFFFRF